MQNQKINECQKQLLQILKYIDKICRDNNIKYSLSCGTMLGAVREKGFIEWDDDADVIFTRNEYDKFINVILNTTHPDYIGIFNPTEKKHLYDFNYRIIYKLDKSKYNEKYDKFYDGLFSYAAVDIFVLDKIPNNKLLTRLFVLNQKIVFGLLMSKREEIHYFKYNFFEKIFVFVLSLIGHLFSIKTLCTMHDRISTKCKDLNFYKLYCTSWKPEYPGYQYDMYLFNDYININFEDTQLMISKCYDNILKIDYDDNYMTPKKTHQHDKEYIETL